MRNSNSREKPSTTTYTQNRLMKTQNPPKVQSKQSLNSTQYKLPPSNKRIDSSKNTSTSTSTKQIAKQEVQFDIQQNMTQSKIFTAKQSLQLLKKKMNKAGMSRQKIPSNNNIQTMPKTNYTAQSMKKVKSTTQKNIENYEPPLNKNQQSLGSKYNPNSAYNKQSCQTPSNKIVSKKIISNTEKTYERQPKVPLKKIQPPQQNYYNQLQQVPITKNQDFNAILQRQLRKQQNNNKGVSNNSNQYSKNYNQAFQQEDQYGDVGELYQCGKGCGRMFNAKVLPKHQKICQKVFQSKRKVFNTAAQRQAELQANMPTTKFNQTKKPQQKQQTKTKIPKWKIQSAQFRAGLKAATNKPLSKQQKDIMDMQKDAMLQCNTCGRRFNQTAGKRHIQFCQKKAKQMHRPSNNKKR